MDTCCPNTVLAGMKKLGGSEAMAGWLLESMMVGPPAEVMPLTSICPIELCPPVTGLGPVILKSPSVGIGRAGGGAGGAMASQACPVRPFVITTDPSSAQSPTTSTNVGEGT